MKPVCNRDCFNCIYDDCIDDSMIHEDYVKQSEIEKELLFPKTQKDKKIAAGKKAYREANREKYNRYMREYRRRRRCSEVVG